ncbi:hypothetical protein RCL1_000419 [Eukaryota sp. TZLM3-RCL]
MDSAPAIFSVTIDTAKFSDPLYYFISLKIEDLLVTNPQIFRTEVSEETKEPSFKNRHFAFNTVASSKCNLALDVLSVISEPQAEKKGQARIMGSLSIPLANILQTLSSSLPFCATYAVPARQKGKKQSSIGSLTLTFFSGSITTSSSQFLTHKVSKASLPDLDAPRETPFATCLYLYSGKDFFSSDSPTLPIDVFVTLKSTKCLRERMPTKSTTRVLRSTPDPLYLTPLRVEFSREEVLLSEQLFIGVVHDQTRKLVFSSQFDVVSLPPGRKYFLSLGLSMISGAIASSRLFLSVQNDLDPDYEITLAKNFPKIFKLRVRLNTVDRVHADDLLSNRYVLAVLTLRFDHKQQSGALRTEDFVVEDYFLPVYESTPVTSTNSPIKDQKSSRKESMVSQILSSSSREIAINDQVSRAHRFANSIPFNEDFHFSIPADLFKLPTSTLIVTLYTSSDASLFSFKSYKRFVLQISSIYSEKFTSSRGTSIELKTNPLDAPSPSLSVRLTSWNAIEWVQRMSTFDPNHSDSGSDLETFSDEASVMAEKGSIIMKKKHDSDDSQSELSIASNISFEENGSQAVQNDDDLDKLVEEVDILEEERVKRESSSGPVLKKIGSREVVGKTKTEEKNVSTDKSLIEPLIDAELASLKSLIQSKTTEFEEIQSQLEKEISLRRKAELDCVLIAAERDKLSEKVRETTNQMSSSTPTSIFNQTSDSLVVLELKNELSRLQGLVERGVNLEKKYSELKKNHQIQNQSLVKLQEKVGVLPSLRDALTRQQLVIQKLEEHIKSNGGEIPVLNRLNTPPGPIPQALPPPPKSEMQAKISALNTALVNNAREYASSLSCLNLKIAKLKARLRAANLDPDESSSNSSSESENDLPPVRMNRDASAVSLSRHSLQRIKKKGLHSELL